MNQNELLEMAQRAVEQDIKERIIKAVTEIKDFDRLMKLKSSVECWTNTKI
jgi:hypothetical protein